MEISSILLWQDVQRPVRGSNVADGNDDDVHQGPDAETAETEEFPHALLPVAQVEPEKCFECVIFWPAPSLYLIVKRINILEVNE